MGCDIGWVICGPVSIKRCQILDIRYRARVGGGGEGVLPKSLRSSHSDEDDAGFGEFEEMGMELENRVRTFPIVCVCVFDMTGRLASVVFVVVVVFCVST